MRWIHHVNKSSIRMSFNHWPCSTCSFFSNIKICCWIPICPFNYLIIISIQTFFCIIKQLFKLRKIITFKILTIIIKETLNIKITKQK
nr:MAG TPA: PROTEIN G PROTEIN G OF BOVINE [Caudoviricetes sp.]